MHEGEVFADVSPNTSSVLAFKPRQVLLLELQRTLAGIPSMAKKRPENSALLKSQQESILICSIALWLESKGLSKVLKRFISATQIQDDDWRARALDLEEIFSNYLDNCNDAHKDKTKMKLEEQGAVSKEKIGDADFAVPEGIVSKKKKNKIGDVPASGSGRIPEDAAIKEKADESNLKLKLEKTHKVNGDLSHGEQKSEIFNKCTAERDSVVTTELGEELDKKEMKKKKTKKSELAIVDEKPLNLMPEVTEGKHKDILAGVNNGTQDSEVTVETRDKKKRKKMKRRDPVADDNNLEMAIHNKVISDKNSSAFASEHHEVQAQETNGKKEAVIDEVKKSSKKRKGLASDENGKPPVLDVEVAESKRRKTNGLETQITLAGANKHADSENKDETFQIDRIGSGNFSAKQTGEILKGGINNGVDKLSHPKSAKKHKDSAEPKTVNAFQRVKIDEVEFVHERLQDNSYWAKDGAENGYGAKAQEVLGQVKGRDFRHEKTKKKRGSYRGGQIDLHSHSIKFNYSDED